MMSIRFRYALPSLLVAVIMMIAVSGCDWDDAGASLFDPNADPARPDAVVTEIVPAQTTLAGVGQVTIHGSNFSATPEENIVLFNDARATVLEASPERLVVRAPNVQGDAVQVRVTTVGAINYSQARPIQLLPAVTSLGGFAPQESPRGMVTDDQGNTYVAIFFGPNPAGVLRITPDNQREQFVAPEGWTYVDMTFHPDGQIYMARGALAVIYRMSPETGQPGIWMFQPAMGPINRLEADEWGNIWAGGTSGNIHHITPAQERTSYPFAGDIRGISYHDGYLYVSGIREGVGALWRAAVTASGAGEFEDFLVFSQHAALDGATPADVLVRDDGSLFLATSRAEYALLHVQADGSWSSFYQPLSSMQPTLTGMSMGPNNYLYASRQGASPSVVRVDLQWREGR